MNIQPLFLQPVFQERIWGGTALRDRFPYNIPSDKTGECWAISAHPNGMCVVLNGPHTGKTLADLWENNTELFGHHQSEKFPLLTKILDANDDLSVQVHPNDEYAHEHENGEYGKTECWYIIDCDKDAQLVFGHNAKSKAEVEEMIMGGKWNDFLRKVKIKPGDFFYVPSGTIHALCQGTLVLETQQSSDTTYRVYDYDRVDDHGKKRDLHLKKAIDVTTAPHVDTNPTITVQKNEDATITTYVTNEFFSVYKWEINGTATFEQDQAFLLVSVLDGAGTLEKDGDSFALKKGDHFILPAKFGAYTLSGSLEVMVSHP
ncbi:mannose-6-phosphate isomerase, class I [Brevibacillus laterosporus]|uniref:mannose-6-phosphate isomerase, class I n=1 Tax=Brevibacillus laterosporus TaxID=1465 RepID=UPI0018F8AB1F|nr:mannose-6-phosphate isomerase, class I [Brevibacillus laterosporus]MBG9776038.1 mannose-6-phosphate isomerase [Brevibacillus laterosporus]